MNPVIARPAGPTVIPRPLGRGISFLKARSLVPLGLGMTFLFALLATSAFAATAVVDDFEDSSPGRVGGRSNTYVMAPSRALAVKVGEGAHAGAKALMLKYDKKEKGGPYDSGGWCGYYILLKTGSSYFDATPYKSLNLWVKGATGEENFCVRKRRTATPNHFADWGTLA